ncbi:MAG: beta-CASP ribonuclease aCPSF1, partial [Candidatus Bathyarchaeales archaeon]
MAPSSEREKIEISQYILEHVPKQAQVTRIEYEGPMLAVYAKKPEILVEQSSVIADIVNIIRKRIVVRSDPSVRLPEKEAERMAQEIIAPEAEVTDINFDPSLGEIIIEAKKPGLVIGKNGAVLQEIIGQTKWRPHVLRSPPLRSKIIAHMRHYLHSESKERERILRTVGERIFRHKTYEVGDLRITTLGGVQEVGRSAFLVQTRESSILLDCGINPGSSKPFETFPRLDIPAFEIDSLDAVVISHAHLDHCGLVPFLYKYGYDGPVYCSAPTSNLMTLLQLDYLDVASKQGIIPPYDQKNVRECVLHTIPLRHGVVTDIAPDIRLTLHDAGHILGSSIIHLHIGEGLHNIVYTGDYKYARTMLLEAAATEFPRVETVITESTYGSPDDIMPSRVEAEESLTNIINETLERKGKVLIPVPAVGRAQEIMLVIDGYMRRGLMKEAPVFIEGMISEKHIQDLVESRIALSDMFLVEVIVSQGNEIRVLVDSKEGVSIEECVELSRWLGQELDRQDENYSLEVSSPGLGSPLKLMQQYEKNIGREVEVILKDGIKRKGKLMSVDEDTITLEVSEKVKS